MLNSKKVFKVISFLTLTSMCLLSTNVTAYNTDPMFLIGKHHKFASQYKYDEATAEQSFTLYPGAPYTSGIERAEDGSEYECPAIYIDEHAQRVDNYNLHKGKAKFIINGSENVYTDQCILYNSRLLIPYTALLDVGCNADFDEEAYVLTVEKDETVLEILPYLIGMRKNKEDGFYVPLDACARFFEDTLYVPVRAIANELGLTVTWDEVTYTVTLDNFETN